MFTHAVKSAIQRFLRGLGLEVQRLKNADVEQQVVKNVLNLTGATVVLDVGANIGQFGDQLLRSGFKGTIVSFEAVPAVHRRLAQHARERSERWIVAPCVALGSRRGQIKINVSANSVSSSVLPMRPEHVDAAPQSRYVDQQTVDVERLDEIAIGLIPASASLLLKIDTQGYEMEVLKGAEGLLHRAVAIQLELSLVPLYDGAPSFLEMISLLESKGYDLFNFVPAFKDKRIGRLLQVDGFFVRRGLDSRRNPPPAAV